MSLFFLFIVCVAASCLCGVGVRSACLPPQTCPKYFQYLTEGDQFVGKLTLTDLPLERLYTQLRLSYRNSLGDFLGNMTFWSGLAAARTSLASNGTLEFRVIFGTQEALPKVTQVSVNGIELCAADNYPRPSQRTRSWKCITPFYALPCENKAPEPV